jgi:hypothetical protein
MPYAGGQRPLATASADHTKTDALAKSADQQEGNGQKYASE